MILDPQIANLLLRWEQLRAQGQIVTPEELCRDCPDLLGELVNGLHALQTTFHTLHGTPQEPTGAAMSARVPTGLPAIGDYQVLGELGHGGMGIVYQAYDRKRGEMIALKTLQRVDPSAVYRLKQEFRALAEVTHPNLVGLYELSSTGQQCFIAMELIDGDHFLAHIRSGADAVCLQTIDYIQPTQLELGTEDAAIQSAAGAPYALSPQQYDRLRAALRQLALGVSALHAHGKLHRDIKPSNVMVTREGRVVLLDFGLVAQLDWDGVHQSTQQHVTGTIAYMAPEQAASETQSRASDWYSVGVMLFEALTGQLPFTGTPLQVLMDKQQLDPPVPADLVAGIPEDLNDLCVALLRKSPEARPVGDEVLLRLGESPSGVDAPQGLRTAPTQNASFIGRESHTAELAAAFQAMRKGRTVVVRLHGRSGAGKSMLAQHALDDLRRRGNAVVLAGKCYERESVPYKALDSLIDALSKYLRQLPTHEVQALLPREVHLLARVFPVLQRVAAIAEAPGRVAEIVDPHELRRRAFAALRELFARLGDRKPLILFIDDLQWGDLDGVTQLTELFRPPEAPVFLLLACYRSEDAETSPCLKLLYREIDKAGAVLDQRQLSVDPLSLEEASELALALLGRRDFASQTQAQAIARESGGNPFFVHVLVQGAGSNVEVAETPTAGTLVLDEVLWTRIQKLPEEPRRLLEVIAVSGQPLRRAEARQAASLHTDEHSALAVLRSGRLVRSSGSADLEDVETYHDRIRETILSHLPAIVVQDIHHRIAIVLESSVSAPLLGGAGPVQASSPVTAAVAVADDDGTRPLKNQTSKRTFDLAYHFDAAGDSERAFPYAMAMADQAHSQYALEIAEQLYRIAERGAEKMESAIRYRVARSLGDVLMLRGRYQAAAQMFQAASPLATDNFTRALLEGKLGELAFKQGDNKAGIDAMERSLRLLGRWIPSHKSVFLLFMAWEVFVQTLHTMLPKLFLARRNLQATKNELLAIGVHVHLARAYFFDRGKIPCMWTHLRSINLAERYLPTLELGQAWASHAPVMSLLPWLSRGEAYGRKSLEIRKDLGDVCGQGQSLHYLGVVLFAGARFDECISTCGEAVRLLERTGDFWERNMAWWQSANAIYRKGDLERAIAEAKRLYEACTEMGDDKVSGFCLDTWSRASGGKLPTEIVQREMQKKRNDVWATALVLLAEGVRRVGQNELDEAVKVLNQAHGVCRDCGMNAWVSPILPWLATVHRLQWLRSTALVPHRRLQLLKIARRAARHALTVARTCQTDLPHALRECGLIAALRGQVRQARKYLDESLAVADCQGARFEHAQTMLARGQVGLLHGWPEAQQDLTTARQTLRSLGADFALDDAATF